MRKVIMLLALSALVIFFISAISFSQTPAVVSSTYRGDINEDGQVNIFDLLEMLKMLSDPAGQTERAQQIADMDENGSVNIFDLLGLLKVLSGSEEPGIIYWGPDTTVIQGITMVSIPGGTFQMGSTTGESIEQPVHQVTVSSFQISAYEITNAQYAVYLDSALASGEISATTSSVTGASGDYSGQEYIHLSGRYDSNNKCWISYDGSSFSVETDKENWSVVYVTWYGSKAFAVKYGLDLPTEAEWEYACRGGKQYEYGTDNGTIDTLRANYHWASLGLTNVGSFFANPFGLYDMSGNVWEWCNDWYGKYSSENVTDPQGPTSDSFRVLRGGGWDSNASQCRSAGRFYDYPPSGLSNIGFRVVRR
jgi:formylglycine-generating enzyme required for sulfatase activity